MYLHRNMLFPIFVCMGMGAHSYNETLGLSFNIHTQNMLSFEELRNEYPYMIHCVHEYDYMVGDHSRDRWSTWNYLEDYMRET